MAYYTATAHLDVGAGVYPGMQVTVTIPQEEAVDVVVLKADALSFTLENQAFVYKMKEDETLEEVQVEVGVSNGNYVEIKSGLRANDTVYAVAKATQTASTLNSLFSGMFGTQQINNNRNTFRNNNNTNRQNNGGSMPGGNAPGGSGGGQR